MLLKDDNLKFINELKSSPQGGDEPYETCLARLEKAAERVEADHRLINSILYRIRDAMALGRARELVGIATQRDRSSSKGLEDAWAIVHDQWCSIHHSIEWDIDIVESGLR